MVKKLRLLILKECNRVCKGCCNKDWDLDNIPVCTSFRDYENIFLTGGEPLLYPEVVKAVIAKIRQESQAKIYLYTAWREDADRILDILPLVDGMTLTLHTRKDVVPFQNLVNKISHIEGKSLRLNVFHGISLGDIDTTGWKVKKDIRWIKDCPLPENEVFMRIT